MSVKHRGQLTSSVLQVLRGTDTLLKACFAGPPPAESPMGKTLNSIANRSPAWDGRKPIDSANSSIHRTMLAGMQHGLGLFNLARSKQGFSVALATLARGAVEAYSRVLWLIDANEPEQLVARHASLEYSDLRYPLNQGVLMHLTSDLTPRIPVSEYRAAIDSYLDFHTLKRASFHQTDLATTLLAELYAQPALIYSGLSATAHGQTWATRNFFNVNTGELVEDEQMLIEYCCHIIEASILLADRFVAAYCPPSASRERWDQIKSMAEHEIATFISRREPAW